MTSCPPVRQFEVKQDNVGLQLPDFLQSGLPGRRLVTDFPSRLCFEECTEPVPDDGVIVDYQDTQLARFRHVALGRENQARQYSAITQSGLLPT